jgi:hypothetical protein
VCKTASSVHTCFRLNTSTDTCSEAATQIAFIVVPDSHSFAYVFEWDAANDVSAGTAFTDTRIALNFNTNTNASACAFK